jgi:hypothetical protein
MVEFVFPAESSYERYAAEVARRYRQAGRVRVLHGCDAVLSWRSGDHHPVPRKCAPRTGQQRASFVGRHDRVDAEGLGGPERIQLTFELRDKFSTSSRRVGRRRHFPPIGDLYRRFDRHHRGFGMWPRQA